MVSEPYVEVYGERITWTDMIEADDIIHRLVNAATDRGDGTVRLGAFSLERSKVDAFISMACIYFGKHEKQDKQEWGEQWDIRR